MLKHFLHRLFMTVPLLADTVVAQRLETKLRAPSCICGPVMEVLEHLH